LILFFVYEHCIFTELKHNLYKRLLWFTKTGIAQAKLKNKNDAIINIELKGENSLKALQDLE